MSRRKACESYVRHFLMIPNDNCCSVNIGSTMYTSVLSILRGSSLGLTPEYLTNHGSGKKTSRCFTKYLFRFVLGIINPPDSRFLIDKDPRMGMKRVDFPVVSRWQIAITNRLSLIIHPVQGNAVGRCVNKPDKGFVSTVERSEYRSSELLIFIHFEFTSFVRSYLFP